MAYFEYEQIQLLEKITAAYMNEFPECDLTKKAAELDLAAAFKKDAYAEETKNTIIERIESGMYDDDEEGSFQLTDEQLNNVAHRVMSWHDDSSINDTIDEAIAVEFSASAEAEAKRRHNLEVAVSDYIFHKRDRESDLTDAEMMNVTSALLEMDDDEITDHVIDDAIDEELEKR